MYLFILRVSRFVFTGAFHYIGILLPSSGSEKKSFWYGDLFPIQFIDCSLGHVEEKGILFYQK